MSDADSEPLRLFESSVVGLGILKNRRIVTANQRLLGTLGYTLQELQAAPLHTLFPSPKAFKALEQRAEPQLLQHGGFAEDVELRRGDGTSFWARCGLDAIDRTDLAKGLIWTVLDVSDIKQAEQALHESAAQLRLFADNVPAMSIVYDEKLHCVFANKRFADYFGLTTTSIVGKHLREIVGEEAYREIKVHFDRVLQGYPTGYERTRHLPHGEARHLDVKLIPHIGEQGQVRGLFAVTADVTERKEEENRIRQLAEHDVLTGVANRALFDERLKHAITLSARSRLPVALLYIDLDKFKPINDALGHDAGDGILKTCAARISQQVRDADTVARIGGDEFAVVLHQIQGSEEAAVVARRILKALTKPIVLPGNAGTVTIGASIGVAMYPTDAGGAETLIRVADAAMYRAKQTGSGYSLPAHSLR